MAGRLLNPGPGELADRLSVITLKLFHKSTAAYLEERGQLILAIAEALRDSAFQFEDYLALAAINGELWAFEDRIRAFRAATKPLELDEREVLDVALGIQVLNDQRAALIAKINGGPS